MEVPLKYIPLVSETGRLPISAIAATILFLSATVNQAAGQSVLASGNITPAPTVNPTDRWDLLGDLAVGYASDGTLVISDGGSVTNFDGEIASLLGTVGVVTVTGSNSTWTNSNDLLVGVYGRGFLEISDGGFVESQFTWVALAAESISEVEVKGQGSQWVNHGTLFVGPVGNGRLTISDEATVTTRQAVVASNLNSIGEISVSGKGTLRVTSAGIDIGGHGLGTITVADGGTIQAERIQLAMNGAGNAHLAINGTNLARGVIETGHVEMGDGAANLTFNGGILRAIRDETDFLRNFDAGSIILNGEALLDTNGFDIGISSGFDGGGGLTKIGTGTLTLNGIHTYTGLTTVSEGTLVVGEAGHPSAHLAGSVLVQSGALLGGSGMVGTAPGSLVRIASGGTLSPGNSIGVIDIAADLDFAAGAFLDVETVSGGNTPGVHNDLTRIGGTLTIDPLAQVRVLAGDADTRGSTYAPNTTYAILTAANPITTKFDDDVIENFAFLNASLSYDPNTVYLTLTRNDVDFTAVANSPNQRAAAGALASFHPEDPIYRQILGLSANGARSAFDSASGEIHASGKHLIDQTFGLFSRTLRQQGAAGLGSSTSDGEVLAAALAYGSATSDGQAIAAVDQATAAGGASRHAAQAWLAPLGGRGVVHTNGNAGKFDWSATGVASGYEGPVEVARGTAYAGFGLGYIRSHGAVGDRLSTLDADGFYLGAHGAWTNGPWRLAGSLSYGANHVSAERSIPFMGMAAAANYWVHTIGLSGEASYVFDLTDTTHIAPLFTLDAGWSEHGGFTETGAGALNLSSTSENWTSLDAGLGLVLSHTVLVNGSNVTLEGRGVWEHTFADVTPSQNLTFAGGPNGFTVNGPAVDRDRLRVGAGISFEANDDLTISANYDGVFSRSQQGHTASFGFKATF